MTSSSPRELADLRRAKRTPVVAIATKSDRVDRKRLAEHLIAIDQLGEWDDIVPCSAVSGEQADTVLSKCSHPTYLRRPGPSIPRAC